MSNNHELHIQNRLSPKGPDRSNPTASPVNSGILRMFSAFIKPWPSFSQMNREGGFLFRVLKLLHQFIPNDLFYAKRVAIIAREARDSSTNQAKALGGRAATPDDLELLSDSGYPQSVLASWFERGARAWLIEREGKLLGNYWLDENERYNLCDWLIIKSEPKDIWALWWWIAPEHRHQGLALQIGKLGGSESARAGFTRILAAVDGFNHRALRATQKFGWRVCGHLLILRILGVTFVRFGNALRIGRWDESSALELPIAELFSKAETEEEKK